MNCKQGDLAIVVRGPAAGTVVRCVRRFDGPWFEVDGREVPYGELLGWELDRPVLAMDGRKHVFKADRALRPVRPDEGEDETLRWAEKPLEIV